MSATVDQYPIETSTKMSPHLSIKTKSFTSEKKEQYKQIEKREAARSETKHERIALVLDMDECLIHSRFIGAVDYRQEEERPESELMFEDCFEIFMDDGEKAVVNKRPGLDEFLSELSKDFDIYAFTAGLEIYGRPLLDTLDPEGKIFKGRFYRDSCIVQQGMFLKDLRVVRSDLSRVVLVDNNPISFLPQPSNGIPVPSFYDDPNDKTLAALFKVLQYIKELDDVRPRLHQMFKLNDVLASHRNAIMAA